MLDSLVVKRYCWELWLLAPEDCLDSWFIPLWLKEDGKATSFTRPYKFKKLVQTKDSAWAYENSLSLSLKVVDLRW